MEKLKKSLKISSLCILLVTVSRLAFALMSYFKGNLEVTDDMIPEGFTREMATASVMIVWVIGLIALLPSFYLGFKGLKIAKNPDNSKAHIIWAMIMLIFSVISVLSSVGQLSSVKDLTMSILDLSEVVLCAMLYFLYYLEAKKIRAHCQ